MRPSCLPSSWSPGPVSPAHQMLWLHSRIGPSETTRRDYEQLSNLCTKTDALPFIYTKFVSYVPSHIYTHIFIKVVIGLEGMHITSQRQKSSRLRLLSDKKTETSCSIHYYAREVSSTVGYHRDNVSQLTVSEKIKKIYPTKI